MRRLPTPNHFSCLLLLLCCLSLYLLTSPVRLIPVSGVCSKRCPSRGARRWTGGTTAGLQPATIRNYQSAVLPFIQWCLRIGVLPEEPCEYDDLLVEYRYGSNDAPSVGKGTYGHLLSGIEKVLPHLRGHLILAHEELNAWRIAFKPRHATPLLPPWAYLLALGLCLLGVPRVAAGLLLQTLRGLRPGEMLALLREGLVPDFLGSTSDAVAYILLGAKTGAKSGRPQSVRCIC